MKKHGKDFAVVGINRDPPGELDELIANGSITWRNFSDRQDGLRLSKKWGLIGASALYLLDQKGVIRYKGKSLNDEKFLEEQIRKLIAEGDQ